MKKRLPIYLLIFAISVINTSPSFALESRVFKTKYTNIHYSEDKELNDFIWRIGGSRMEVSSDAGLASSRVDRIVERIKTILGMWPRIETIDIYIVKGELQNGDNKTAYYDSNMDSIYISIDRSSDGILAHEIAHAIVNKYFISPPPSKIQEILTQYVDKYLWSDY